LVRVSKSIRWAWLFITFGLLAYGLHLALIVPADADQGNVQRIFYYHLPNWIGTSTFFLVNLACSIIYLLARHKKSALAMKTDALVLASAEMGVVYCLLGLVTGSLWGRVAWGIWWTWDARLTATFVLWLIYVSYLLLHDFASGPAMQTIAAAFAIFGYCDMPIVYMSTRCRTGKLTALDTRHSSQKSHMVSSYLRPPHHLQSRQKYWTSKSLNSVIGFNWPPPNPEET
jgi:heme exporter protein C